ncbi:MAG: HEPN domain-containing protein [Bacteroidales bacterium]|nr:HEPN domain-containing protein [Bacteroidales bacterium]
MSDFNFNLIASSISIKFTCPFCNEENETDGYYVPEPDYSAETGHESTNSEYYEHNCIKCDELFNIELHNSYNGGYGQIESDSDNGIDINDIDIEEYYNDFYDDYDYNTEVGYYEDFKREIVEIYSILENSKNLIHKNSLHKMLYAHTITIMETYLSDTLIQKILSSKEIKRKFIENYTDYDTKKICFKDILSELEKLEKTIKTDLQELIYHNLGKIKPIYKAILDIEFGKDETSKIMQCVNKRHHIVHRNGKDKDNNPIQIYIEDVEDVLEKVYNFISNIEKQISPSIEIENIKALKNSAIITNDIELPF